MAESAWLHDGRKKGAYEVHDERACDDDIREGGEREPDDDDGRELMEVDEVRDHAAGNSSPDSCHCSKALKDG